MYHTTAIGRCQDYHGIGRCCFLGGLSDILLLKLPICSEFFVHLQDKPENINYNEENPAFSRRGDGNDRDGRHAIVDAFCEHLA